MSEGTLRVPAYLDHILLAIRRIGRYTKAMTQEEFSANEMAQDAVIRNIEIIGENDGQDSEIPVLKSPRRRAPITVIGDW